MTQKQTVYKMLEEKFGGAWRKHSTMKRWLSKDHKFHVYISCQTREGKTRMVYRRSDNLDIVHVPSEHRGKR